MTAYLTDSIDKAEIERGFAEKVWVAAKLYPAGATTNSQHGVTNIRHVYPVLEVMQRIGMPLLVHGERSEEHTSELQVTNAHIVCRLLLEKKKIKRIRIS